MSKQWMARIVIAAWSAIAASAMGQVPQRMNFQGILTNASGVRLTGDFPVVFAIYGFSTGGTALWSESHPSITVTNGFCQVVLGSITPLPLNLFDGAPRFLGIKVGADPEMTPRQELTSVPSAFRAQSVVGGNDGGINRIVEGRRIKVDNPDGPAATVSLAQNTIDDDDIRDNGITDASLADNSVGSSEIKDGAVGNVKIVDGAVTSSKIVDGGVTSSKLGNGAVTSSKLGDGAVTSSKIVDGGVTSSKLVDGAVTSSKIADGGVTSSKIASGQVVKSINSLRDNVTLAAGDNIGISQSGSSLTITAFGGGGGGNTLDQAYNEGGPGAGRTINADAGTVQIAGPDGLDVNGHLFVGRLRTSSTTLKEPLQIRAKGTQEGLIAFEDPNGNKKWHLEQNFGGNTPGLNFVETSVADFRLFIRPGGNVGIGTGTPTARLHVIGNILATGTITPGSSRALKENIQALSVEEAIASVEDLKPVKFNYKAERNGEVHLGFIAEDVPDLVATSDRQGVDPMDIVALLTKVVQEQQRAIRKLEEKIVALEKRNK